MLEKMVLSFEQRKTIYVLMNSTCNRFWRKSHTLKSIVRNKPTMTIMTKIFLFLRVFVVTKTFLHNIFTFTSITNNNHIQHLKRSRAFDYLKMSLIRQYPKGNSFRIRQKKKYGRRDNHQHTVFSMLHAVC